MVELAMFRGEGQRSKKLLDEPRVVSTCKGSFDFVTASLREGSHYAQDDSADEGLLLVAQRFYGIQTGGLDCGEHAADDSHEA